MRICLIGVDIGTSGTKAAIFTESGRELGSAFEESRLVYPRPGWVEQDLEEMYGSCLRTVREALAQAGVSPCDVAALAVDGQMAGIGGVGADGLASLRYDSWLDTRCEPYLRLMQERAGELIHATSGAPPTYDHGPKMLWWMHEEPAAFAATAKFVVPSAYAAMRLTGLSGEEAFIDYTQLHFSGFGDILNLRWSDELCELFGLPAAKLPRIVAPGELVGRLTKEAASACGLLAGTPVAAGAGDQAATSLGAGVVEPGQVFDVAGTASVFSVCTDRPVVDLKHRTFLSARSIVPGRWIPLAYINGGGLCLRWFRDEIAGCRPGTAEAAEAYAHLDKLAAALPPGSGSLVCLPHFGGRVTPADPAARGLWLGLSWGHRLEHLYRAILEGIAYEYRCYVEVLEDILPDCVFTEARVIGGGAASSVWNQIKADVLGLPYVQVDRKECATWGSALVAGHAVGVYSDVAAAATSAVHVTRRHLPDWAAHRRYQAFVEVYKDLFDRLAPSFRALRRAEGEREKREG